MQPEQQPTNTTPPATDPVPAGPEATVDTPATVSPTNAAPKNTIFPSKSSKKKWVIIAAALVVLLGGGAAGALWWTSPQKAFDDATSSYDLPESAGVKGSMVVTPSGGPTVTIDMNSKYAAMKSNTDLAIKMNAGAVNINLTGALATSDTKSVYFKINDVRKTVESFAGSSAPMIDQNYGGLIDKIDGKWVEITEADMKDATKDSGTDLGCISETLGKITRDKSYLKDLYALYEKNKYISVKETLGSETINGKDSHHYVLALDKSKMQSFDKAMQESRLAKELKKCIGDEEAALPLSAESVDGVPKMEIWVDKWSHKLTKLVMTQDQEGTSVKLTATVDYAAQNVTMPKADTQFKDLLKEAQDLQPMLTPAGASGSGVDLTQI